MYRFSHSVFAHLVDSRMVSSPRSLSRSDEEDDSGVSGKQFFSPTSEVCSDIETSSVSTGQEFYSFRSLSSSPMDSPSMAVNSPVADCVVPSDHECYERNSDCAYDNSSVYYNQAGGCCEKPLDFERNESIWYPPHPETEEDDAECLLSTYDDEDDVIGDSTVRFTPSDFTDDDSVIKEKPSDDYKEKRKNVVQVHFRALVSQLLKAEGMQLVGDPREAAWLGIVSSLAWQAATYVRPDTSNGGSMDPGTYVKVKCVSCGNPADSTLVRGVVCTKNLRHKRMTSQHKNPKLLILGGALEFQKLPSSLASINTLLEQEIIELKKVVGMIEDLRPNVLLVEKSVASHAQDYLLAKEISLVLNVKRTLLERISKCTGAQIVPSLNNLATAKLGQCEAFRVEKIIEEGASINNTSKKSVKTIMFFEGCPRRLGCTVLLRGGCYEELKKIKHVIQYACFAAYHLSLETSFLADEGATLPFTAQPSVNIAVLDATENTYGNNHSDCQLPMVTPEEKIAETNKENEVPGEFVSTADAKSILVSFSSRCILKGTVCEHPRFFRIKFYGSFDKPLGRFLRENLFDSASNCVSCKEPVDAHVYCYTHRQGSLTISVKRLPSLKLSGERDGRIWMWHRCLKCERKDGIPPAACRVVMSDAAWGLSFGKFLELSFSNNATANRIASCGHSLQKDCLRFYGFGNTVAFFRYSHVDILSVCLPPFVLDFGRFQQEWVRKEAAEISDALESLHTEIFDILESMDERIMAFENEPLSSCFTEHIRQLKDLLEIERSHYDALLHSMNLDLCLNTAVAIDILELNSLRRCLLTDAYVWENRLAELTLVPQVKGSFSKVYPDEFFHAISTCGYSSEERILKSSGNLRQSLLSKQCLESRFVVQECESNNLIESDLPFESVHGYCQLGHSVFSRQNYDLDEKRIGTEHEIRDLPHERLLSSGSNFSDKIDSAWDGSRHLDSSSSIFGLETGAFESSMDNSCLRSMYSSRVGSFNSCLHRDRIYGLPPASYHLSSVKSFDAFRDFPRVVRDSIPSIRRVYSEKSPDPLQRLGIFPSYKPVLISSISQILSNGARLLIPQTGLAGFSIAVYENEPTSIICHALSSPEYLDFLTGNFNQNQELILSKQINDLADRRRNSVAATAQKTFAPFQLDNIQHQFNGSDGAQTLHESSYLDSNCGDHHLKLSFDDELSIPDDKVKFTVTCYFAKQFDILRKNCCPSEVDFIRSLSRCRRWSAQGGKSNVYFAKSLDDRFIIKQVMKAELLSFEQFAPHYFKHLMESMKSGSPSCLAKILGIFQVIVKHLRGGREVKMDIMVMENLFFRRNLSSVYDLKGSSRSRYNSDSTGNNTVLLDLNLLETLRTKPIFLESKAKRSLERAVWNDTSFLARIDVMDYSLLVGIDEESKELVIGIIDFIRQYTWDKHLESWVKSSGILGGSKNASPTVVSPVQYKRRFRKAMSSYFLTIPDQWTSS